jgi:tetratricopeptide (TPR) repeat protein
MKTFGGNKLLAFYAVVLLVAGFVFVSCDEESRKHKKLMAIFEQGFDYYYKEEYQKAHDCFDECIKMDSTYVEFYENRGSMRGFLNDMEGSKQDCNKALTMDSCSKFALLGLADYHDKNENYQKASVYYEKLIICDPTFSSAYMNYGISCYQSGDYRKAIVQFLKCIEYVKDNPDPYECIGEIYLQLGDSLTGKQFLNRAEELKKSGSDSIKHIINLNI